MITLRPYQQECIDIINSKESGRYLVQLSTGLGKTVIFTNLPHKGRMLILSHREELVRQPLKYFTCSTGVEMAGESSHGEEVVSASVQTMIHRLDRFGAEDFDTIIVDECFPSSTLVDGKQIVELKEGDVVNSYNHITDKIEKKKITHIFKRKPSAMMKVILSNGQSIVCTPNHPFWVDGKGYTAASGLKEDDHVIRMHILRERNQQEQLYENTVEEQNGSLEGTWENILLNRVLEKIHFKNILKDYGRNEQEIRKPENERTQPDEQSRSPEKSFNAAKRNWLETANPWRQWNGYYSTTAENVPCLEGLEPRTTNGIPYCDKNESKRNDIPDLLQGRYCVTNSDDRDRDRWEQPLCIITTGTRCEEDCVLERTRVERVEICKQTSDGTFGNLCPDGYVYNIEVEDNHNYFVEGVLVHNCHHAAAKSYKEVIGHFKPRMLLGFTATPNRADGAGLKGVFDEIIYKKDLRWGIQNGYLCDILCKRIDIGYDLSAVHTRMGDYAPGELEKAMDGTADAIAQTYRDHAQGATLIFAVSVDQCHEIAERIEGAEVVTGQTKNRAELIARFTRREIPCLVNCMVFTEGTDMPLVETVIVARPTKSDSLYAQMVGRGLRLHPEKKMLTLIDCVGVTGKASLCTAPSLLGVDIEKIPKKKQDSMEGMLFELPEKAKRLADTPESWIENVRIVDLWAKEMKYQLHGVNWFQMPDGTMICSLPNKMSVEIPPADELGETIFCGQRMEMQEAFDHAYELLSSNFADSKAIWDKNISAKWGSQPASEAQVKYVKRIAKKYLTEIDFDTLTKAQAGMIINRIKGGAR